MSGKQKKNHIQLHFFFNRLQGGRFQVTMLLSWLVCIVVVLRGIKMAWEEKSIFKQQKKIFYIFWFIYLWSPRRKKSFAQQADVGCLYCGFLFKMGDSDNLSSGEAPENPLKIRIYSSFFSRKKEEIIIILEKRFHDTHKWIIFKSFKTHNQD